MRQFLLFLSLSLLISCSVQKRKYQKGFYVSRLNQKNIKSSPESETNKNKVSGNETIAIQAVTGDHIEQASAEAGSLPSANITKRRPAAEDSCDVLLFKDGSEVRAKISEVNAQEVKYKRCDNADGPSYVTRKSDLFMIKYVNGTRELIKSEAQVEKPLPTYRSYTPKKPRKVIHPLAPLALIFGILSIALGIGAFFYLLISFSIIPLVFFMIMVLTALLAVIISKTAINRINEEPEAYRGKGLAIPGLVMGLIMISIYALIIIFLLSI